MEKDLKPKIFLGVMIASVLFISLSGPFINIHSLITLLVQIFGILLIVWALIVQRVQKSHHQKLPKGSFFLTQGPYEILRHPIYAGLLLIVSSLLQYNLSFSRTLAFFLFIGAMVLKIIREEYILEHEVKEYKEYKKNTKSIIPYLF